MCPYMVICCTHTSVLSDPHLREVAGFSHTRPAGKLDVHPCSSPVIASDAPWSTGTLQPSGPGDSLGRQDEITKGPRAPTIIGAKGPPWPIMNRPWTSDVGCQILKSVSILSQPVEWHCNLISNTPGLFLIWSPLEITKLQVCMFPIVCCWWDPRMLSPTH